MHFITFTFSLIPPGKVSTLYFLPPLAMGYYLVPLLFFYKDGFGIK